MQGLNAREITEQTLLLLGTVKNYTSSIYAKLGVTERSKAIVALHELLVWVEGARIDWPREQCTTSTPSRVP
jgi:Bacterial regulatory proteins, luxR family